MAKKQTPNKTPVVSSLSMKIRAEVNQATIPDVDRTKQRKTTLLDVLDKATANFANNLANGKAEVTTISDLERIAKLTLTLSGETTDIKGGATVETTEVTTNIPEGKVQLDTENPAVKEVFNMLYGQMNEANDE